MTVIMLEISGTVWLPRTLLTCAGSTDPMFIDFLILCCTLALRNYF